MKKISSNSGGSGTIPSPGTQNYCCEGELQKGSNLERIPLQANSNQQHTNYTGVPYNNGRGILSKGDDPQKWICNPVTGDRGSMPLVPLLSHHQPMSNSAPLGPHGYAYYPAISLMMSLCDGGTISNFMGNSPFSAGLIGMNGVVGQDCHANGWNEGSYGGPIEPCTRSSASLQACPDMPMPVSVPSSQEGFPFPFRPTSSHLPLPSSVADAARKGSTSIHWAPFTPDRGAWRTWSNQYTELTDLFRNECLEEKKQDECSPSVLGPTTNTNEHINLCTNEDPLQPANSSPTAILSFTPLKETHNIGKEEDDKGLDLNTPQQKTRKKSYRPKSIVEDNPQKTTKLSLPKQYSKKEKKSASRTPLKRHATPPADSEVTESLGYKEGVKFSCRRALFSGSDHQPSQNSVADVATKGTNSLRLAPVTPDRGAWGTQCSQYTEFTHLFRNERLTEKGQESLSSMVGPPSNTSEHINLCTSEDPSQPADPSVVTILSTSPSKETSSLADEENYQGLDLNHTPAQKMRKKKHRPKVITEGKPKKTPNSSTPKQDNEKEMKKSVCKTTSKRHSTPPAGEEEIVKSPRSKEGVKSSCKRSLKFDKENLPREGSSVDAGSPPPFNSNLQTQPHDICVVTYNNSLGSSKSTVQLGQGLEVQVNTPGIPFDLNCSLTQMRDDYISLPQNSNPCLPIVRKESTKEKMKVLARKKTAQSTVPYVRIEGTACTTIPAPDSSLDSEMCTTLSGLKNGSQSAFRIQHDSNNKSCAGSPDEESTKKGSKRSFNEINNTAPHSTNVLETSFYQCAGPESIQDTSSPEINKKKRTDIRHNEVAFSMPLIASDNCEASNRVQIIGSNSSCDEYTQSMAQNNVSKVISFINARKDGPVLNRIQSLESMACRSQINIEERKSKEPIRIHKLASITTAIEGKQFSPSHGNKVCEEIKAVQNQEKPKRKKSIKKGPTTTAESVSCFSTNQAGLLGYDVARTNNGQFLVESRGALSQNYFASISSSRSSSSGIVPIHFVHEYFMKNATCVPSKDPIEDIVERFKCLNINKSDIVLSEAQNALVPYAVEVQMIPYGRPYDLIKKQQRPRAKVDLDEETDRVWRLLMWKDGSGGLEGMDQGKEKWWEEERQAFQGRADSFIARMHLVQGDRRFSQWKGSVLDSVVGVFLTQNVSDHLSSSAFMALAARFPLKSRTTTSRIDIERMSKFPQEPVVSFPEYIKGQDKILNHGVLDQCSTTLQEAESVERDMVSSIDSFGSNIEPITVSYSMGKQISICDKGPEVSRESPENRKETPRALDDIVSSQNSFVTSQSITDSNIQRADQVWSGLNSNFEVGNMATGFNCEGLHSYDTISFTELLRMQGTKGTIFEELYSGESDELILSNVTLEGIETNRGSSIGNGPVTAHPSICQATPQTPKKQEFMLHAYPDISSAEAESVEVSADECRFSVPSSGSETTEIKCVSSSVKNMVEIAADNSVETMILPSLSSQCISIYNSPNTLGEASSWRQDSGVAQSNMPSYNYVGRALDVRECSSFTDNEKEVDREVVHSNSKDVVSISEKGPSGTSNDKLKSKKQKSGADKNNAFDWDSLRRQACSKGPRKEKGPDTMDSLDYEALRCADVTEISDAIRERGMNNRLAERIKDFLNRLVREHGSIDLEWLRDVPPDKAKDYLLSVRGLGLKSVECVRLLTLHQLAFPVDTNVGRICVRLGWVPLQPLPESLQLHLLELYPVLESIQKYLWPRLCKLDQRTLYELHYQMITFGKVFCTKSKPNCNACPMRADCRHFASAFASARLALPGPKDKTLVTSSVPLTTPGREHEVTINPLSLPPLENTPQSESSVPLTMTSGRAHKDTINTMLLPPVEKAPQSEAQSGITRCQPIIEEPASPEPENLDVLETQIEDAFWEDPDEIPTIKLNFEEFTQNVQNYIENNMQLQDGDISKALVALSPEAASIPVPKLKNLSRLRTEHLVYELPDSHTLLKGLDPREPDDPSPYLLAIWTPGETAQSIQPSEISCNSQKSGDLCDEKTCFACNNIREANAQTVRGTLLIPCRTAMRGSFPLNGTYFQVNEVFADHDSSLQPLDVPRALIWNLPRRTVFFGTSIPTIFRGLTTEGIQYCFWRGFVCVRGFDQKTRAPRPLMARLHFPASKQVKAKNTPKKSSEKDT